MFESMCNGIEIQLTDEIFKALTKSGLCRSTELVEELVRILERM